MINSAVYRKNGPETKEYVSAEFRLDSSHMLYQFKVRKNASEPMFALVKEDSPALESLKQGNVIPMTYYFEDKSVPAEKKETRIKYISHGPAKGHYMIALDVDEANLAC